MRPSLHVEPVCKGLTRTQEGVWEALGRYKTNNPDLDHSTLHLMGCSAIGFYFGRRVMEAALGQTLPNLFFRDTSWRWWNVLALSGLELEWPQFKADAEKGGVRIAHWSLKKRISKEELDLFLRRCGTDPHNSHKPRNHKKIWTKGGVWDARNGFTKMIVLKQPLERPIYIPLHQRLVPVAPLVEREIMSRFDPDTNFPYVIKYQALAYARIRLTEFLGWPKSQVGDGTLSWFFQAAVPTGNGLVVDGLASSYIVRCVTGDQSDIKRKMKRWEW